MFPGPRARGLRLTLVSQIGQVEWADRQETKPSKKDDARLRFRFRTAALAGGPNGDPLGEEVSCSVVLAKG